LFGFFGLTGILIERNKLDEPNQPDRPNTPDGLLLGRTGKGNRQELIPVRC
jgi:hypothetical protein